MIMRDTIEHELYLRNNSEEIAQVDFDFDKSGKFGGPQVGAVHSRYITILMSLESSVAQVSCCF